MGRLYLVHNTGIQKYSSPSVLLPCLANKCNMESSKIFEHLIGIQGQGLEFQGQGQSQKQRNHALCVRQ